MAMQFLVHEYCVGGQAVLMQCVWNNYGLLTVPESIRLVSYAIQCGPCSITAMSAFSLCSYQMVQYPLLLQVYATAIFIVDCFIPLNYLFAI